MTATRLERRLKTDVRDLIRAGDISPTHLQRRTPLLVSILTGQRSLTAATTAAELDRSRFSRQAKLCRLNLLPVKFLLELGRRSISDLRM